MLPGTPAGFKMSSELVEGVCRHTSEALVPRLQGSVGRDDALLPSKTVSQMHAHAHTHAHTHTHIRLQASHAFKPRASRAHVILSKITVSLMCVCVCVRPSRLSFVLRSQCAVTQKHRLHSSSYPSRACAGAC